MRSLPGKAGKEEKIAIKKIPRIVIVSAVFAADRLSKIIILRNFREGEGLVLLPGVLRLTRVDNSGAAFGLLKGHGNFLIFFSVGCILALAVYLLRSPKAVALRVWASALMIGGALGNLYDRIRYGYVVDFLDFRVWPVFNLADSCISVGVGLMIMSFL